MYYRMILLFSICLDNALRFFLSNNRQYVFDDEKLDDLGKNNVCISLHDAKPTHSYTCRVPCSKEVVCCHINRGRRVYT